MKNGLKSPSLLEETIGNLFMREGYTLNSSPFLKSLLGLFLVTKMKIRKLKCCMGRRIGTMQFNSVSYEDQFYFFQFKQ